MRNVYNSQTMPNQGTDYSTFFSPKGSPDKSPGKFRSVIKPTHAVFRDPAKEKAYAEKVYKAVIDVNTGTVKEQFLQFLEALMISPDQILDLS